MHRPAAQRRGRHAEQRAGDEAGGKAQPSSSATPPTAAIASVSAARSHSFFAGIGEDAIGAINAAPGKRAVKPGLVR